MPMKETIQGAQMQQPVLGMALLDRPECDFDFVCQSLWRDWGIRAEAAEGRLALEWDGMQAVCGLIAAPVPGKEAESCGPYNWQWPQAEQVVSRHRAHVLIAVLHAHAAAVEGYCLFTKLASSVLALDGALALYDSPMLWEASLYRKAAADLKRNILPTLLWVYMGIARTEQGTFAFTNGLKRFAKEEIEITASRQSPSAVFDFLCDVVNYVISETAVLKPGETIGLNESQRLPITRSPGVSIEGETLKIAY